jgi:hypothetical protein
MVKCSMCNKKRADNEMRPLIGVDELDVADKMADEPISEDREIGGAEMKIVCRSCWKLILDNKGKDEIIEMLETMSGILFEMDKRLNQEALYRKTDTDDFGEIIEKELHPKHPQHPQPQWPDTRGPIWIVPPVVPPVHNDIDMTYRPERHILNVANVTS